MPWQCFDVLVLAVEPSMQISQVNDVALGTKIMTLKINECCGIKSRLKRPIHTLHDRVIKATTVSLNASVATPVEERHVRWTTYSNLLNWFQNFWVFLIKYEFAQEGSDRELVIDDAAKRCILNINETELVLDGSKTRVGGRPEVSIYGLGLPMAKRPVTKLAHKCTGIFWSSAVGECAPIHFQLVNQATTEDGRKLQFEFFKHIRYTCGKFGRAEAKNFPCTVGMNEKGGMNDVEFEKYINNIINDMFPDMEDIPGKCVLLKVDSGPGRNCATMLVKA